MLNAPSGTFKMARRASTLRYQASFLKASRRAFTLRARCRASFQASCQSSLNQKFAGWTFQNFLEISQHDSTIS
jgi:hypothetical protein